MAKVENQGNKPFLGKVTETWNSQGIFCKAFSSQEKVMESHDNN